MLYVVEFWKIKEFYNIGRFHTANAASKTRNVVEFYKICKLYNITNDAGKLAQTALTAALLMKIFLLTI